MGKDEMKPNGKRRERESGRKETKERGNQKKEAHMSDSAKQKRESGRTYGIGWPKNSSEREGQIT